MQLHSRFGKGRGKLLVITKPEMGVDLEVVVERHIVGMSTISEIEKEWNDLGWI